jgi:hypothetical protein
MTGGWEAGEMIIPSPGSGPVTETVGYLEAEQDVVTAWLLNAMDDSWIQRPAGWGSLADAVASLTPSVPLSRHAVVASAGWSLILNNGPMGTDVGLLPSYAASELGAARSALSAPTIEFVIRRGSWKSTERTGNLCCYSAA